MPGVNVQVDGEYRGLGRRQEERGQSQRLPKQVARLCALERRMHGVSCQKQADFWGASPLLCLVARGLEVRPCYPAYGYVGDALSIPGMESGLGKYYYLSITTVHACPTCNNSSRIL